MPSTSPRRRDAVATRAAILQSAVRHFARAGYDGAGVRDIAADAGFTAMLVNRYFGSKEQLFVEAVEMSFSKPVFVVDEAADLARQVAAALVAHTDPRADPPEPFLIMLRSLSNPRATEIVRDAIERHVGRRLTRQLAGPGAHLRGEAILSTISGVLLMRSVVGTSTLAHANPGELQTVLEAAFTALIGAP
ncbi:TetR/AcrR family transcriptional regulator [Mycolicibacterium psychrotolerans]|uniref:TetR family transcriptional regulator n=1 Tax=Mycolicibacterium psychrotolerans TaxID=216929 RepID=A0A7I7MCK9_9MYCO|nr:TetR/AcrR family transcriptional regulator [Mycolicibacterium psychrotolerans]BBX69998.1 TetR family transcriptional regulator [Mycolicibacterium psychrotolerans]